MSIFYVILAIVLMSIAHLTKVYRWKQFIKIYEKPKDNILIRSLSLSYDISF